LTLLNFRSTSSGAPDGRVNDTLLLLHRSGCMQLTFAMGIDTGLASDTLLPLLTSATHTLEWVELAEPVLLRSGENPADGHWLPELEEGVRWLHWNPEQRLSVADLFVLYQHRIESLIGVEVMSDWVCYPSVFIGGATCCTSERRFRRYHPNELTGVVIRQDNFRHVKVEQLQALLPPDKSLLKGHSKYVGGAMTTEIAWSADRDNFAQQTWTLLVVENALLRVWQMRALATRLREVRRSRRKELHLQQQALFGLRENRESVVNHLTARDQSDTLVREMGGETFQQDVLQLLAQHGQVSEARRSARQARTQSLAAVLALTAATVFGLPSIQQTLVAAESTPKDGLIGTLASPLRLLAERPHGAFIAYLGVLTTALLAFVLTLGRPSIPQRLRRRRKKTVGQPWPYGTLQIIDGDEDDADDELLAGASRA
jgi:hypothetical protein